MAWSHLALAVPQACYRVRQIAQDLWEPLLDRDKDYIATPKANGYRSLHSTLLVPSLTVDVLPEGRAVSFDSGLGISDRQPEDGLPLELQIRTARKYTYFVLLLFTATSLLSPPPQKCLAESCLHT